MATLDLNNLSLDTPSGHSNCCAVCGNPSKLNCQDCVEGIQIDGMAMPPTVYCSTHCQTADLRNHRAACKAANERKQLYRAGEFVQAHWYEYRRQLDRTPPKLISRSGGGKLQIDLSASPINREPLFDLRAENFVWSNEKRSLVAFLGCSDRWAIWDLAAQCLQGIDDNVEVLELEIKPSSRHVLTSDGTPGSQSRFDDVAHSVFRVEVAQVQYALDLSGAQYGHYQPVTPWETYETKLVTKLAKTKRLEPGLTGHDERKNPIIKQWMTLSQLLNLDDDPVHREMFHQTLPINEQDLQTHLGRETFGSCLETIVHTWLSSQTVSVAELLHLEEPRYRKMLRARTAKVAKSMQQLWMDIEKDKGFEPYLKRTQPSWYVAYRESGAADAQDTLRTVLAVVEEAKRRDAAARALDG